MSNLLPGHKNARRRRCPHRVCIVLANGLEYKEAEMSKTVNCRVSAGDKLTFELKNTYPQLNVV